MYKVPLTLKFHDTTIHTSNENSYANPSDLLDPSLCPRGRHSSGKEKYTRLELSNESYADKEIFFFPAEFNLPHGPKNLKVFKKKKKDHPQENNKRIKRGKNVFRRVIKLLHA